MADFYVLPPRRLLGDCLAKLVRPYVPGIEIDTDECAELIDSLIEDDRPDGAFIVHREDLPDGEDVETALRDGYGAEDGDRIIHVSAGPRPDEPRVRIHNLRARAA